MTHKSLFRALATSALVAIALPAFAPTAFAEDKGPNFNAAAKGEKGGVATAALAQDLFALGVANDDALTVLTAAKLAASVDITEQEAGVLDPAGIKLQGVEDQTGLALTTAPRSPSPTSRAMNEGDPALPRKAAVATFFTATSEDNGAADAPVDTAAMFAKATEMAGEDEVLVGLIEDAQAEGSRGRIGGASETLSRLPAGQTDVWEIPFYGDSYAEVAVVGDGDANLDVLVTDENGNTICYDVSWSDKVYCDFVPAWNGYFYVTVQNNGGSRNSYYLMTN
jgi:hypothetical protein